MSKRAGTMLDSGVLYGFPPPPEPERHLEVDHPGELLGFDCFHVGRTATALPDGRVLIVGGKGNDSAAAEVWEAAE